MKNPNPKISSPADLARHLHVSRQLISAATKRPGAPSPRPDGTLDVEAWREFLASTKLPALFSAKTRLAMGALKVRLLKAQVAREERRDQSEAGNVLDKDGVSFGLDRGIAQLFDSMNQVFLNQMPSQLVGLNEIQIATKMQAAITRLEAECRTSLTALSEAKV